MPGTIHVSVLELVGLPSPPQSSSLGVKVSMGKQAHDIRDKENTSFSLASFRDNLNVSIHDSEGNEIAHTDVETRSIVEKGTWDDTFPLEGGGNIRMRLHFILNEDEKNRIRSMRESVARKKHDDLMKRSRSSSELASASGGSSVSSQDLFKSQHQIQKTSANPSDGQTNNIYGESKRKVLNKIDPGQKKQAFSTSKSTGALDKLPAYQLQKGIIQGQGAEQQSQLDITPSNVRKMMLAFESSPSKEEFRATNKTTTTAQLSSSTSVDFPSKIPTLRKTVAFNTQSVLSKIEMAPVPSTTKEIWKQRGKILPATYRTKETALLSSNTRVDTLSDMPSLKKAVFINTKPVLSKLDTAPAPSTSEEVGTESGKLLFATNKPSKVPKLEKIVAMNSETVSSNRETAPAPSTPERRGRGREKDEDYRASHQEISDEKNISETKCTKEENEKELKSLKKFHISPNSERSTFSLKTILEALPRKPIRTNLCNGKHGSSSYDSFVVQKKWRSKQWISSHPRAKSKVIRGNEHYSFDNFRGWIFLDEMISSCVLSDHRLLADVREGCLSNCSQDSDQEKLKDAGGTQNKSEKGSVQSKNLESDKRPNKLPHTGPAGQVVKIAIMVGFGLLVFLTRQRK